MLKTLILKNIPQTNTHKTKNKLITFLNKWRGFLAGAPNLDAEDKEAEKRREEILSKLFNKQTLIQTKESPRRLRRHPSRGESVITPTPCT